MKETYEIRDVFDRDDLIKLYADGSLCYGGKCLFDLFQEAKGRTGIFKIFSAAILKEAGVETFYLGYSAEHDLFIFGAAVNLNGKDCQGYLAVKYQAGKPTVEAIHLHPGDAVFGNVLDYARTRFKDLKNLQMD